jgi:hypothetical protein
MEFYEKFTALVFGREYSGVCLIAFAFVLSRLSSYDDPQNLTHRSPGAETDEERQLYVDKTVNFKRPGQGI